MVMLRTEDPPNEGGSSLSPKIESGRLVGRSAGILTVESASVCRDSVRFGFQLGIDFKTEIDRRPTNNRAKAYKLKTGRFLTSPVLRLIQYQRKLICLRSLNGYLLSRSFFFLCEKRL